MSNRMSPTLASCINPTSNTGIYLIVMLITASSIIGVGSFYYGISTVTADDGYLLGYQQGIIDGNETGYIIGEYDGNSTGFINGNYSGFISGYELGYDQGIIEGNLSGYVQGFLDGNHTGYDQGLVDGQDYIEGYIAGSIVGYTEGFEIGNTSGYNEGFQTGNYSGFNSGYVTGNSSGYILGFMNGNNTGYGQGLYDGYLVGFGDGNATGYLDGIINGNATGYINGYLYGLLQGNDTGYQQGFLEGTQLGYIEGFLAGNASNYVSRYLEGYSDGFSSGFDSGYLNGFSDGYSIGYSEGYADAFVENTITFHGSSDSNEIDVYNLDSNKVTVSKSHTGLSTNQIFSINTYANNSVSINMTVSNVVLSNDSIIQDTFAQDYTQSLYTATTTLTLYQQFTVSNNAKLRQIYFYGQSAGNARPTILLYNNNGGLVGSLITTLYSATQDSSNAQQLFHYYFSHEIIAGSYFIGIKTSKGTLRLATSYTAGVNNVPTYYGTNLATIDYAINYTITPPTYTTAYDLIDHAVLNANYLDYYIDVPFIGATSELENLVKIYFPTMDIKLLWHWALVQYNIAVKYVFNYGSVYTLNTTIEMEDFELESNGTSLWEGFNITKAYLSLTDIVVYEIGFDINEYEYYVPLSQDHIFIVGEEYYFHITTMNMTIYNVTGTTWVCNFHIWYEINDVPYYTEKDNLYVFDVFRV